MVHMKKQLKLLAVIATGLFVLLLAGAPDQIEAADPVVSFQLDLDYEEYVKQHEGAFEPDYVVNIPVGFFGEATADIEVLWSFEGKAGAYGSYRRRGLYIVGVLCPRSGTI